MAGAARLQARLCGAPRSVSFRFKNDAPRMLARCLRRELRQVPRTFADDLRAASGQAIAPARLQGSRCQYALSTAPGPRRGLIPAPGVLVISAAETLGACLCNHWGFYFRLTV